MTSSSSPFTPSPRLLAWAEQAGYRFDADGPSGSSAFHNAGWETAFFVRAAGPFLRISSSTRNQDEEYLADVSTADVAEDFSWLSSGPAFEVPFGCRGFDFRFLEMTRIRDSGLMTPVQTGSFFSMAPENPWWLWIDHGIRSVMSRRW